jgi:ubiquinone/menaquinone biosynthesis C-methylase UbiE
LRVADVTPGMRVLDIATGTGLSAAALTAVGPTGHVTAADVSPAMAGKARERLGNAPNASVFVEDGQALSFANCGFDAVLCNLGLIFFPDPVRGLSEFRRVLSRGRTDADLGIRPLRRADLARELHLVSDDDHRHAVPAERADHLKHLADQLGVERRSRLVEQYQRRPHRHRAGDRNPLLPPARQLCRALHDMVQ